MSNYAKRIEEKIKVARRGKLSGKPSGDARVPPGQKVVTNFPVLDLGVRPELTQANWRLRVYGLVEREVALDWNALAKLPQVKAVSDFHCVTHWTQFDLDWEGVRATDVLALARPLPTARFVILHSYDDYTTNLPLDALMHDDVLIAHRVLGAPLAAEHGGPVRLVVPSRYGWKSAKWLKAIEFVANDRPGFWEERGYHNNADPWTEERYG
jgi:DMSO/TMAO reductase YedYZ molybdopterin-dependent catalytic subunit